MELLRGLRFEVERETKNTIRFREVGTEFIGTLYIRKSAFIGKSVPSQLLVNVKEVKDGD